MSHKGSMNINYNHITREIERVRHRRRLLAAEDDFLPLTRTGFRQLQEKLAIDAAASRKRNSQLLQQLRQLSERNSSSATTATDVQLYALRGAYLALVHENFPQWYRTAAKYIQTQVQPHQQQHMSPPPANSLQQQQPFNSDTTSNHQSYQQQQVPLLVCTQAKPSNATAATGHSSSSNMSHGQYCTSGQSVHTRQVESASKASDSGPVSAQDTPAQAGGVGTLPRAALEQLTNSMAEQLVLLQQLVRQQHGPQLQQHHHQPQQQEQLACRLQSSSKSTAAPVPEVQQQILPIDTSRQGQEQGGVVHHCQQRLLGGNLQQQQQQQSELHTQQSELLQQQTTAQQQQPAQRQHSWQSKISLGRQAVHQLALRHQHQQPDSINEQQQEQQHQNCFTQQSLLPRRQELGANTAQQETHNGTLQQQQQQQQQRQEAGEQYHTAYHQKGHPPQHQQQQQPEQHGENNGQSQMSQISHMPANPTGSQAWKTGKQAIAHSTAANQSGTTAQQSDALKAPAAGPLAPHHQQVPAGSRTTAAVFKGPSHNSGGNQVVQQHATSSRDSLAAQQQAPIVAESAQQQQQLRAADQPVVDIAPLAAAAVAAASDPTQVTEQQQTKPDALHTHNNSLQQQQMPETAAASSSTDDNHQRSSNSGMHPAAAEQLLSLVDNMLAQQGSHMSDDDSSGVPSVASLAESSLDDNNMLRISDLPAETATDALMHDPLSNCGQSLTIADRVQQVLPAGFHRAGREQLKPASSVPGDAAAVFALSTKLGVVGDAGAVISASEGVPAAASDRQLTGKPDRVVRQSQLEYTTPATPAVTGAAAAAAVRVGSLPQSAAVVRKAPPPPPPLPAGGFLPHNSIVDHPAAFTASVRSSSPTGKQMGSAVAAALAQLQHSNSNTRQKSGEMAAGTTAVDSSALARQSPQGFGIGSLAVGLNLDGRALAAAAAPVGTNAGLGRHVTAQQESNTAVNEPQHQVLGIRSYQRATSINYAQPLSAGGPLLSPATRLSLGAVGNDAALSSGRPSLSSESDMGAVYSPQGSNKRSSLGAAGSGVLNVVNPKLQPPLRVPDAVVPGSQRGGVGGDPSSGAGPGAEGDGGLRVGEPVPGLQLGGMGIGSKVDEAPPLHRRDRQQDQRQQQKLALGGVTVQAQNVYGRQGSGTATNSAGRLVSKVLNTGLTDFGGSDSEDDGDDGAGVESFIGNRAKDPHFGNSSSHNIIITQQAAAAGSGGGRAMRVSGVPQVGIRHSDVVCAGDDEFDF